jgi:hypothetical protein
MHHNIISQTPQFDSLGLKKNIITVEGYVFIGYYRDPLLTSFYILDVFNWSGLGCAPNNN